MIPPVYPMPQPQAAKRSIVRVYKNTAWESWNVIPFLLGIPLFLIGLLLQILDVVRVYNGIYNFGLTNFDLTRNSRYPVSSVANAYYLYAEPWHMWPWTYAGAFFGLVIMLAGLTGILSGIRKSYTLIYAFFALSLLSFLFSIFLIVYYSVILNFYHRVSSPNFPNTLMSSGANRPEAGGESFGLSGTQLALSILSLLLSFLAMIFAVRAGAIGTRRKDYVDVNSMPKYPYSVL